MKLKASYLYFSWKQHCIEEVQFWKSLREIWINKIYDEWIFQNSKGLTYLFQDTIQTSNFLIAVP